MMDVLAAASEGRLIAATITGLCVGGVLTYALGSALRARRSDRRRVRQHQLATVSVLKQRVSAALVTCERWWACQHEQAHMRAEEYEPQLKRLRQVLPALRQQAEAGCLESNDSSREACRNIDRLLYAVDEAGAELAAVYPDLAATRRQRRMLRRRLAMHEAGASVFGQISRFATTLRESLLKPQNKQARSRDARGSARAAGALSVPPMLSAFAPDSMPAGPVLGVDVGFAPLDSTLESAVEAALLGRGGPGGYGRRSVLDVIAQTRPPDSAPMPLDPIDFYAAYMPPDRSRPLGAPLPAPQPAGTRAQQRAHEPAEPAGA